MRDRLIELIQDATNGCKAKQTEIIADYLLENGVIVPPCKVGDTVYYVYRHWQTDWRITEAEVWGISTENTDKVRQVYLKISYRDYNGDIDRAVAPYGVTAFLTYEEAEAETALRARENNGNQ